MQIPVRPCLLSESSGLSKSGINQIVNIKPHFLRKENLVAELSLVREIIFSATYITQK